MTSGGSRRRECLKPAKKQALRRPERCAAQVPAWLSTVEPPLRRERRHAFPSGEGGALIETGMIVQERHTAPVGDRVGFFADAGHSLRLLPPEVTRGTSRC